MYSEHHAKFLSLYRSFYAPVEVGDINFRMIVDTGSSDLWILSSSCETETCQSQPRYPLGFQSPSFQSVNENTTVFSSSYADGTCACFSQFSWFNQCSLVLCESSGVGHCSEREGGGGRINGG